MIKINEKYYIDANVNCYTLKEKTQITDETSKNFGEDIFKDLGYYVTIEGCLKSILKTELRSYINKAENKSLKDLVEKIKELEAYLKSLKLDI